MITSLINPLNIKPHGDKVCLKAITEIEVSNDVLEAYTLLVCKYNKCDHAIKKNLPNNG